MVAGGGDIGGGSKRGGAKEIAIEVAIEVVTKEAKPPAHKSRCGVHRRTKANAQGAQIQGRELKGAKCANANAQKQMPMRKSKAQAP